MTKNHRWSYPNTLDSQTYVQRSARRYSSVFSRAKGKVFENARCGSTDVGGAVSLIQFKDSSAGRVLLESP